MTQIRPFSLHKSGPAFGSKETSPEGRIARGLEPTGGCHVTDPQIRPNLSNERNLLNDRTPPLSPERGGDSLSESPMCRFECIKCDHEETGPWADRWCPDCGYMLVFTHFVSDEYPLDGDPAVTNFVECDLCSNPGVCRSGQRCPLFLPARIGGVA